MSKIFSFESPHIKPLPSPFVVKKEFPATKEQLNLIQETRSQLIRILNKEDSRLLLIVGPCSIHDIKAAKEYALKLQKLSERLSKHFLILLRTYFEKPRTSRGWKGMLYDPHLDGSNDIATGLRRSRELLLWLAKIGLGTATEFLDPISAQYLGDLISWACVGARTVESQIHRQFASGLPMPISFKNGTSGRIDVAINGVLTALDPHTFFGVNETGNLSIIQTQGNPHAHISLRGGMNQPNYDEASITMALEQLQKHNLPQRLIVDCSHDNSSRNYEKQGFVFRSVIEQYAKGNAGIRGLILESHLFSGNQTLSNNGSGLKYAVSLTDPCLDWDTTEELIEWAASKLKGIQDKASEESTQEALCVE